MLFSLCTRLERPSFLFGHPFSLRTYRMSGGVVFDAVFCSTTMRCGFPFSTVDRISQRQTPKAIVARGNILRAIFKREVRNVWKGTRNISKPEECQNEKSLTFAKLINFPYPSLSLAKKRKKKEKYNSYKLVQF